MANTSGSSQPGKPTKPHRDFPLFPHKSGRWAKKIKGAFAYFGKVSDDTRGERALQLWLEQKDDLLAGRKPSRPDSGKLTVRDLVNAFLNEKESIRVSGEITSRTFSEYHATCERVVKAFGRLTPVESLKPEDFSNLRASLATTRGPVTLGNEITRVKMIFAFGAANGLIPSLPVYGQSFAKPKRKVYDKAEAARGAKDFTADEIRRLLKATEADPTLNAVLWVAITCAYGQADISSLPIEAVDLEGGWATFPRPKTGVPRRAKLWPETVAAIKRYLAVRPCPPDPEDAGLLFLNGRGRRFVRPIEGDDPTKWGTRTDVLGQRFRELSKALDLKGRRGFYAIRHSYQTAAENSFDMPAVMYTMGHRDQSISARYRGTIPDARLELVSAAVRTWLLEEGANDAK